MSVGAVDPGRAFRPECALTCCCTACPAHLSQTEDLGRMYRLFSRITKGLDPVAELFKVCGVWRRRLRAQLFDTG